MLSFEDKILKKMCESKGFSARRLIKKFYNKLEKTKVG